MNRLTLQLANLAAEADFGKSEIYGIYHNEALFYVMSHLDISKKESLQSLIKQHTLHFFAALPNDTFGKLPPRKTVKQIANKVLDTFNLDELIANIYAKKPIAQLNEAGNKQLLSLMNLIQSFAVTDITPGQGKTKLIKWQQQLKGKKLPAAERSALAAGATVARYSLAYWISENNPGNGGTTARKKCDKDGTVSEALCDSVGAVIGAIFGNLIGGPVGAVIGGIALGEACSAGVRSHNNQQAGG